jgi:hypothetical protein
LKSIKVLSEPDKEQLWERTLDQGVATFETVHRKKDGSDISVEVTGILLDIDEEHYSVSFVKDITERKEAEKKPVENGAKECARLKRWSPWALLPAGSPTISIISWPQSSGMRNWRK